MDMVTHNIKHHLQYPAPTYKPFAPVLKELHPLDNRIVCQKMVFKVDLDTCFADFHNCITYTFKQHYHIYSGRPEGKYLIRFTG